MLAVKPELACIGRRAGREPNARDDCHALAFEADILTSHGHDGPLTDSNNDCMLKHTGATEDFVTLFPPHSRLRLDRSVRARRKCATLFVRRKKFASPHPQDEVLGANGAGSHSVGSTPDAGAPAASAADSAAGKTMSVGYCAGCHGAPGEGLAVVTVRNTITGASKRVEVLNVGSRTKTQR